MASRVTRQARQIPQTLESVQRAASAVPTANQQAVAQQLGLGGNLNITADDLSNLAGDIGQTAQTVGQQANITGKLEKAAGLSLNR